MTFFILNKLKDRYLESVGKSRLFIKQLNIRKSAPALNLFLPPEYLNSWDNDHVLVFGKMTKEEQICYEHNYPS